MFRLFGLLLVGLVLRETIFLESAHAKNWNTNDSQYIAKMPKKRVPTSFPNVITKIFQKCNDSNGKKYDRSLTAYFDNEMLYATFGKVGSSSYVMYRGQRTSREYFVIRVSQASSKWSDIKDWVTYKIRGQDLTQALLSKNVVGYHTDGNFWRKCKLYIYQPDKIDLSELARAAELTVLAQTQEYSLKKMGELGLNFEFRYDFLAAKNKIMSALNDENGGKIKETAQPNQIDTNRKKLSELRQKTQLKEAERERTKAALAVEANRKEAARKKAEEEAKIMAAEAARRKAEAARIASAEAVRKKAEEEARLAAAEAERLAQLELKRRQEEELRLQRELEEARRQKAEAARIAAAEAARKKAEEEARMAAAEAARRKVEEEAKIAAAEEARRRAAEAARLAEAEAARKKAEEEQRRAEMLEAKRLAEERKMQLAAAKEAARLAEERRRLLLLAQDKDGPSITARIVSTKGASAVIEGKITDQNAIASLFVDKEPYKDNDLGTFIKEVYIPRKGKSLIIKALDEAGNVGSYEMFIERGARGTPAIKKFAAFNPVARKAKENKNAMAIIIGVADYERIDARAVYADEDAKSFYDYANLKLGVPEENILELVNEKADRFEMKLAVKDWFRRFSKTGETELHVFFAGHGIASEDGKNMYLLPYDGSPRLLDDTAILRNEFFKSISAANPRSVTVFLDTCYSGTTRGTDMLIASRPIAIRALEQSIPDNFTVMTAAAGDQTAKPLEEAKHGMFSYFLMKGMEGEADANNDNEITAGELHSYVQTNVIKQSSGSQTPELQGDATRVLVRFQ